MVTMRPCSICVVQDGWGCFNTEILVFHICPKLTQRFLASQFKYRKLDKPFPPPLIRNVKVETVSSDA